MRVRVGRPNPFNALRLPPLPLTTPDERMLTTSPTICAWYNARSCLTY